MKKLTIPLLLLLICGGRLGAETQKTCQLQQLYNVSFMTYSSYAIQSTGSVMVNCTSGVAYSIALSAGGAAGATVNNRAMTCSSCTPSTLGYQLFKDATYTVNWGNEAATDVNATGTGNSQTFTIYGQIPANEAFYASTYGSNYNDYSVLVTIYCNTCTNISANNQNITVHLQQTEVGCGISATDLNFGNYTGTVLNATTAIQVGCSSGTTYKVGLSAGNGAGASTNDRRMTLSGGSAQLKYGLFSDSGRRTNWGNTAGTDTVSGTGTATTQTLTVYGQVPAKQSVAQGTYTDTITATLTY
jgi:spore coat protein U-like protein